MMIMDHPIGSALPFLSVFFLCVDRQLQFMIIFFYVWYAVVSNVVRIFKYVKRIFLNHSINLLPLNRIMSSRVILHRVISDKI